MKFHFHLTILCLICSVSGYAQLKSAFVNELNTTKAGQGNVKVYIDENIKSTNTAKASLAGSNAAGVHLHANDSLASSKITSGNVIKRPGFKIQVFAGNNPRKSKEEAYSKQSQLRNYFPEVATVVKFESPFWRLRAGNYKTYAEAAHAMAEMKKAFPSFGREMYIVRDQISIVAE